VRLFIAAILLSVPLFGQGFAAGVKGGVRMTDDLEGDAASESKRYLVGPAVELQLPFRLAVEVDALYSRFGLRSVNGDTFGSVYIRSDRANSWEFPILAKFRPLPLLFVEGGYVPRTMSGRTHSDSSTVVDLAGTRVHQVSTNDTHYGLSHGVLVGGGLELPLGHLRLAPELRYTYWGNRALDLEGSHGYHVLSTQNRADILIGIWWK
jgi:hypothetical protein